MTAVAVCSGRGGFGCDSVGDGGDGGDGGLGFTKKGSFAIAPPGLLIVRGAMLLYLSAGTSRRIFRPTGKKHTANPMVMLVYG